MTTRTAIYARTSPDCPLSEDEQIDRLRTIAAERGWTVTSVFSDRPTTVRKGQDRRPGERALIEAIRRRSIDKVLVWSYRPGRQVPGRVGWVHGDLPGRMTLSLCVDEQRSIPPTSNGMSLFDLSTMMALHLRQSRRSKILRGQSAARALSIRFGRPPIATSRRLKRLSSSSRAGKGVRQVARLAGISPASVSRIKMSMNTEVTGI